MTPFHTLRAVGAALLAAAMLAWSCGALAAESGVTYYVRTDGGLATQCDGRTDAPYTPQVQSRRCAWKHPMVALPPGERPRIAGGDTLLIDAGQYMIGWGADGAEACSLDWTWDCMLAALPSGPDAAHPTRLLGRGHDSGCKAPPQLWGTQRVSRVVNLEGTRHAVIACLDITDHAGCIEAHSGALRCERDRFPYGLWASVGLYASDSSDVQLADLNIHGLAGRGVLAGRLRDWSVTRVRVAANGWAGWDGDLPQDSRKLGSANAGTLRFSRWRVEYNGCAESWPDLKLSGCWGQTAGGYGDGVGTAATGGHWVIEDSVFRHNTSDGLDLLYLSDQGQATLKRVWAEGNAGNQIKLSGTSWVENSVIIGTCGHFDGQAYTYNVDACRAGGDALVMVTQAPLSLTAVNNTIVSEGNVTVLTRGPQGAVLNLRNNILVGLPTFLSPSRRSADTYAEGQVRIDESHSVKQDLRNAACRTPSTLCASAGLVSAVRQRIDPNLVAVSPARGSGLTPGNGVPADDHYGRMRPAGRPADRGAVQAP